MPESAKRHLLKGKRIAATLLMALMLPGQFLLAQPGGGVVTSGAAVIERAGAVTDINQSTEKASINWQSFSIKPNETVNFNQPGRSSVTLNRVIGNERSVLEGALNANGQVFLLNSNGVLLAKGSAVNAGGFLASTLNFSDEDFQAGRYIFNSNGKNSSIINQGTITAKDGGYVALLGGTASNQGVITATKGTVALASGDKIRLNLNDATLSGVIIDEGTLNALVENNEAIYADGGRVFLTAKAANDLLTSQINMNGIIRAQTVGDLKGSIELNALGGETRVSGTLDASGSAGILPASGGGFIETSGDRVTIADSATITTKAANGTNGEWLIDPDGFTIGATTNDGDMSAATLNANLKNGNVTIASTSGKGSDGNINVNGAVSWSDNTLTLNATNNVFINNVVTATGKARLTATYGSGTNKDETPMGLYTAVSDSNSRLDFSGTGALNLGGDRYTVINSAAQLTAARSNPNGRYALGSDINAATMTNWTPLDNNATSGFTGKFNGLGHQIDNFTAATSFFGIIGQNAAVSNFAISYTAKVATDSTGGNVPAGMLAGVNRGTVVNTSVAGTLKVTSNITSIGGLVGVNHGLIAQSTADVSISDVMNTFGGLVGVNESTGRIIDSSASRVIMNSYVPKPTTGYAGGFVGLNSGIVQRSYAGGRILLDGSTAPTLMTGGFVGKNTGTISESYTTGIGSSDSAPRFGGFAGENTGLIENAYSVRFNNVSTSANWDAGFVYKNSGTIRNAYATMASTNTNGLRYGFAWQNTGTLENAYWYAVESEPLYPGHIPDPVSEVLPTPGSISLTKTAAKDFTSYYFGANMADVWGASKSGYPILRNIPVRIRTNTTPVYGRASSSVSSLGVVATGLQGGGGNGDYSIAYVDSLSSASYNPFTVTAPMTGGYVDAGVWNASDILTGSPYANIKGVIRVNPKPLTISGVVENKTYDGTTAATLKNGVAKGGLVGLVGSQTLDINYTSAVFQDKNAGTGKAVDLTYTVADGTNGGKLSNYTVADATTATIAPKPVTVAIAGKDREYDGTTYAEVNYSLPDVIAGDELALSYTAAFNSPDAGSRTVAVSGLSLTGADSGNYARTGADTLTIAATIAPRALLLYGLAEEGSSLTVGAANLHTLNIVQGDTVKIGGSVRIAVSTAGAQPITDFSALTVNNPNYTAVGSVGNIIIGGANLILDHVVGGDSAATVSIGKTTTVTQKEDKAIIDWLRFSLGADESLTFNQPNSSSIVLNRVTTDLPSVIAGTLRANGRVFILNSNGVLFTANSRVSVGALVASTFNLKDDDFLNGNYVFTVAKGNGSIISEGDIVIAENGFVALAGNHDVKHTGTISGGDAALFASTDSLTLNPEGRAVSPRPPLYAIGDLAETTTVGGRINIGSATKGGELLTAGSTVTTDGLTINTGTGGAWVYDQNDAITIGAGRFAGSFVNDNLNTRSLSLRSREGDITVNAAVDWTANTTLGLSAKNDIKINKPIKATGANAGLVMDYGGDYHLITPATFSGAVLDATGKPVARQIPAGTEYSSITLNGANSSLKMNGNDYTVIRNMEEFAALDDATGTATGYFALAQDLDATAWSAAHTGTPSVVASLSGTLAGFGHKVDNLTLHVPSSSAIYGVGLIGLVAGNNGNASLLRDIGVTNVDLSGNGGGALVYGAADTIISQAYSTGKISSQGLGAVGGLVGLFVAGGTGIVDIIEHSYSDVDVTVSAPNGGGRAGGLLGAAESLTTIRNSHATGGVSNPAPVAEYVNWETGERVAMFDERGLPVDAPLGGTWHVERGWARVLGGLVGTARGSVESSYATGEVTSYDGESIGGLIGGISGAGLAVTDSFATGDVTGGYMVGGLIGEVVEQFTVDNTYATGNVTGTRENLSMHGGGMVGGLIGSAVNSNISNSHATGNVVIIADGITSNVGGLVGRQNGGTISDSYATGTIVGNGGSNTGGLVGGSNGGTISDSYYQDANAVDAAGITPVRAETGRIVDDVRMNESESTRKEHKNTNITRGDGRSGSSLASYIYQEDDGGYSARVKAVIVEDECSEGEDCER